MTSQLWPGRFSEVLLYHWLHYLQIMWISPLRMCDCPICPRPAFCQSPTHQRNLRNSARKQYSTMPTAIHSVACPTVPLFCSCYLHVILCLQEVNFEIQSNPDISKVFWTIFTNTITQSAYLFALRVIRTCQKSPHNHDLIQESTFDSDRHFEKSRSLYSSPSSGWFRGWLIEDGWWYLQTILIQMRPHKMRPLFELNLDVTLSECLSAWFLEWLQISVLWKNIYLHYTGKAQCPDVGTAVSLTP